MTHHLLFFSLRKAQKLLSVNTETKRYLGIKFQTWHHLHKYAFKGRFLVNDAI